MKGANPSTGAVFGPRCPLRAGWIEGEDDWQLCPPFPSWGISPLAKGRSGGQRERERGRG